MQSTDLRGLIHRAIGKYRPAEFGLLLLTLLDNVAVPPEDSGLRDGRGMPIKFPIRESAGVCRLRQVLSYCCQSNGLEDQAKWIRRAADELIQDMEMTLVFEKERRLSAYDKKLVEAYIDTAKRILGAFK